MLIKFALKLKTRSHRVEPILINILAIINTRIELFQKVKLTHCHFPSSLYFVLIFEINNCK